MKVVFLKAAQAELEAAAEYYAEQASPGIAGAFLQEIQHAGMRLAKRPEIGPAISERLRILHLRRFPYSLIYRLTADTLIIQAVAHQRRRPGYWRARR